MVIGTGPRDFETRLGWSRISIRLHTLQEAFMKILNSEFTNEMQEKKGLPMLAGRPIVFMIHALNKISDVQGRALGMHDLLTTTT